MTVSPCFTCFTRVSLGANSGSDLHKRPMFHQVKHGQRFTTPSNHAPLSTNGHLSYRLVAVVSLGGETALTCTNAPVSPCFTSPKPANSVVLQAFHPSTPTGRACVRTRVRTHARARDGPGGMPTRTTQERPNGKEVSQ